MTLPGPLSKARVASRSSETRATLAMPPMFCSARTRPGARKSSQSAKGRSGAPSPPRATSATRKSPTVTTPVRAAITAGSPSCSVEATPPDAHAGRLVPHGLAVAADEIDGVRRRRWRAPRRRSRRRARSCPGTAPRRRRAKSAWIVARCAGVYGVVAKVDERDARVAAEAVDVDERGVDAVDRGARHEPDHALAALSRSANERIADGYGRWARMRSHSSRTAPSPPGRRVT